MNTLSVVLHAPPKVGKTTLTSTAPPPLCVLDAEGGWRFIRRAGYRTDVPLRRRPWDPEREDTPRWDNTWDFCHVMVRRWSTLTSAYARLTQAPHDFRSLILDSVTESQRKLKAQLRGLEQMRIQDWGDLLVQMDKLVRDIRDLVLLPPPNPLRCVVFVAETEYKDDRWRPAMQGQIGRALPYWVDICGYLSTVLTPDERGQATRKMKTLLIGEGVNPAVTAGERVQGALPDVIENPNITEMMKTIFGEVISPNSEKESEITR